jgi:hypothetical protein
VSAEHVSAERPWILLQQGFDVFARVVDVFVALTQLDCAMEVVAAEVAAPAPAGQQSNAPEHYIEFQDALTGEALGAADVASLSLSVLAPTPRADMLAETSPDGTVLRRVWSFAPNVETYTLRVEGTASRRYFGCERSLPVAGARVRRVRVSLVPRARDVVVTVAIRRGSSRRELGPAALHVLELRPSAQAEREVEVRPGRCSGERPPMGSHWCVQSLALEPGSVELTASVPGYGLASLSLDGRSTARTIALTATYDGHLLPSATIRVGPAWAPLGGGDVGVLAAFDVLAGNALQGQTCPLAETCVRPVMHLGAGTLPYSRTIEFLGPGDQVRPEGEVRGGLGLVEVGGGVTVVPAGTGDSFRVSFMVSGGLAFRGEESFSREGSTYVLSPATTRFGVSTELHAAWRFLGPLVLYAGARLQGFPAFGGRGRRFSFLGDAPLANESASLLQAAIVAGLGVEP